MYIRDNWMCFLVLLCKFFSSVLKTSLDLCQSYIYAFIVTDWSDLCYVTEGLYNYFRFITMPIDVCHRRYRVMRLSGCFIGTHTRELPAVEFRAMPCVSTVDKSTAHERGLRVWQSETHWHHVEHFYTWNKYTRNFNLSTTIFLMNYDFFSTFVMYNTD